MGTEQGPETGTPPPGGEARAAGPSGPGPAGELALLERANEQLRLELEALRGDMAARLSEQDEEIRVQREACTRSQKDAEELREENRRLRAATKELKAQNLELQHSLNTWGVPVCTGEDEPDPDAERRAQKRFFPPVVPLEIGVDPVPIILRGDIRTFHLTSVMGFLESTGLTAVLTVLSGKTAAKLYIEGPSLRLAAWNERDTVYGLPRLLQASELAAEESLEPYTKEGLYDFEIANRLIWEGRLDRETVRACLREHTRVVIARLFQARSGSFFVQEGRPSCDESLLFRLSITDLLLRTATDIDQRQRETAGRDSEGSAGDSPTDDVDELDDLGELEEFEELET